MNPISFQPYGIFKNPYIQSILASKRPGGHFSGLLQTVCQTIVLTCENNEKLLTSYFLQPPNIEKGCVILLHGWEGSSESRYIREATRNLFYQGYSIFRLNLRDHGATYHLNEGLFFGTLFDEVFQAVTQIASMAKGKPVFLVGYSLGANFALRIARQHSKNPIQGLKNVLAIGPPLNPDVSTDKIDQIPLFRYSFLKKWLRSLKRKQQLFPHLYSFDKIFHLKTIREVTEVLLEKHTHFKSAKEYFLCYTLLGDALKDLRVPTTIITAADDPIIPVADFYELVPNDNIRLIIHQYGGHIGFIEGFRLKSWLDRFMQYFLVS
ncbi:MAG: alpha/beta fold hydrolase [Candidatus Magnetomorum sp.]|nr:alpha/beta fold hydrolase [Candidatus Magnetomorum sp.]